MNRKVTFFLLLTAIGLGIFVFTTSRWRFSTDRLARPGAALFDFDPSSINSIRIKNGDHSMRLKKDAGTWTLSGDFQDVASPEALQSLFKSALETIVIDRIEASEIKDTKDLSKFGVLKSGLQLDFKGDIPPSLLFGKSTPDGSRTYVAFENSNNVFLIPSTLANFITQPAENFRDRRLTDLDPSSIGRFSIQYGKTWIDIVRNGSTWRIVKPKDTPANTLAVESLLEKILKFRLGKFLPSAAPEADSTNQTAAMIRLYREGDPEPQSVAFGNTSTDGTLVAMLDPRRVSGTVDKGILDLLKMDLDALRDKSIANVNPDLVDLIRISTPEKKRDIRRSGDAWGDGTAAVQKMIDSLRSTQAASYKPATPTEIKSLGLDTPLMKMEFVAIVSENTPESPAGEQVVMELLIGKTLPDGQVPVQVKGQPEIILAPASLLESLPNP